MLTAQANPRIFDKNVEQVPTRNGYGEALVELGKNNHQVVVLTADLADSTKVSDFGKQYPERFIECGVAEQNMMGIAAGLAAEGKIPFVSSYAVFSPGRNWDQARVSVAYSNLNVKIAGAHTGVSVGPDGATHQALEDMAIMRTLPNLVVMAPCDDRQTYLATQAAADYSGPVYFRFAREKTPVITATNAEFKIGQAQTLWDSSSQGLENQVAIVACGPLVYQSLVAARQLHNEGIGSLVINNHTIKPLDKTTLLKAARDCGAFVTVEEHQIMGGMGSAIAELTTTNYPIPIEMVGMQDCFGESGEPEELLAKYGMSMDKIKQAVNNVLRRKQAKGGDN